LWYVKDEKYFAMLDSHLKIHILKRKANLVSIQTKFDREMGNYLNSDKGIKLLVQKCRKEFRRTENKDFYSDEDFKAAERKFVKYCLRNRTRT
jgi:hypothetical protein